MARLDAMTVCAILQPIHAEGQDLLRAAGLTVVSAVDTARDHLVPVLYDAEAVITRNWGFPGWAFDLAPNLRVISVHGTGTDRIDMIRAKASGTCVRSTHAVNARSVAEHALGLMLSTARAIPDADRAVRSGDFAWRDRHSGIELAGRCLGLWGYGAVAQEFASMAQALGMRVLVLSKHADAGMLAGRGLRAVADVPELLEGSDVVSLHGRPGPRPLLGKTELARLRPGAIVINTARGALIDDAALIEALRIGQLRAAALDVYSDEPLPVEHPLCSAPNVLLTPHIGGATEEALIRMARGAARNVIDALA